MFDNTPYVPYVFAAGRGLRDRETFSLLLSIAGLLGAEVVATRGAAEDDLLDADRIIGMSGKRICTDLYVSFGVSGSNFHTAGIKGNPYIIAVNTDPHCRMFELADECLCEDVRTALQRLASRLDRSPMNNPPDSLEDMIRLLRDGLTPACESRRTTPCELSRIEPEVSICYNRYNPKASCW